MLLHIACSIENYKSHRNVEIGLKWISEARLNLNLLPEKKKNKMTCLRNEHVYVSTTQKRADKHSTVKREKHS